MSRVVFRAVGLIALMALTVALAQTGDESASLRRVYTWFHTQSTQRQTQLRQLHEDFSKLDSDEQQRLTRVMQNYNAWLSRLPESDRKRIQDASNSDERFRIISEYKDLEWVLSLPKSYRDLYATLEPEEKAARLKEWRHEESERSNDWQVVRNNWKDISDGRILPGFNADLREKLEAYLNNLRPALSLEERQQLDTAKGLANDGGLFAYLVEVVKLSDRYEVLPGKVGPKDFQSLPQEVRETLLKDKHFRIKKGNEEIKELKRQASRWPVYAIELTRIARSHNIRIPPMGDCRKDQMPEEVKAYMNTILEPFLRKSDAGKAQLESLQKLEGQWPEYPQRLLGIIRENKLPALPGWMLPGPDALWNRLRPGKSRVGM